MAAPGSVHIENPDTGKTFCGQKMNVPYQQAKNYFKYWFRQYNPCFCEACKELADNDIGEAWRI